MKKLIHWYDLSDHTVIKIEKDYQIRLLSLLKSKFMKQKEIAEELGLNRHQINLYNSVASNFSVKTLRKICNLLQISSDEIEPHVTELGRKRTRIVKPNLPFNLASPQGAALISIVNSEGHIPKHIGATMHIRVCEIEMLERAVIFARHVFGEFAVEIRKTKGKNTHEIFFPSVISDSLVLVGLARGSKAKNNPHIPFYILSDKELGKIYIGWSFACEMECSGKVIKLTRDIDVTDVIPEEFIQHSNYGVIFKYKIPKNVLNRVLKKKCNLLEGEIKILENFGIYKTSQIANLWKTKDGRITAAWKLVISDKGGMKKLLTIDIPLEEKVKKINSVIMSYKRENILNIDTYRKTVEAAKTLQATKKFFTRRDLINYYKPYSQWAERRVDYHLRKLERKFIIIKISAGKYRII